MGFGSWTVRLRVLALLVMAAAGCGTTRVTDTQRTATEQLLVSDAVDQAVSSLDFRSLSGKPVYFDPQYLDSSVDRGYLVSSLRQHLLACGCILQEDKAKAQYVVEARCGGVGTDRHSLLLGVPQMSVPVIVPGQPSAIPEIPLAKKTDQKGVAKIAVFAYNRNTGRPVWQSGIVQATSTAKDTWLLGVGPLQRGTVRDGTEFAGAPLQVPLLGSDEPETTAAVVPVTRSAAWEEPPPPKTPAAPMTTIPAKPGDGTIFATGNAPPPAASPNPPPPPAPPPPTPNAGGQAETEPAKALISGFGMRSDGGN